MFSSLPSTFRYLSVRRGFATRPVSVLLLLITLLLWSSVATWASPLARNADKGKAVNSAPCSLTVYAFPSDEEDEVCMDKLTALVAYAATNQLPASISTPSAGQARKAAVMATYVWLAPSGATLNTYTSDEVIATFSSSGPKTFTVTATDLGTSCTATNTVTIDVLPLPDVTIYFPNSQTLVPISGVVPTVTQTTPDNNILATGGVFYEWYIVIDRINGYEIRHADSNETGQFRVTQVGPYTLTVTASNGQGGYGCKRTVRGVIIRPPGSGG